MLAESENDEGWFLLQLQFTPRKSEFMNNLVKSISANGVIQYMTNDMTVNGRGLGVRIENEIDDADKRQLQEWRQTYY